MSKLRWLFAFYVLCCISCSGGGGADLNPVQGKVTYKGQPAAGAVVTFHPTTEGALAERAFAVVEADGAFTLKTGEKNGARAGNYNVTIVWEQEAKAKGKSFSTGGPETEDRLRGAYANASNTPLKTEVKKGPNQVPPFDLK